ncbi:MAG: response regulator transcription factor [Bacteroidales bacterium]|nr:response regulator transcription factor [Bacteroidales bacterium]MBS3777266.1 response regulator transcription factor [Bacteroidales bacterium]
MIRLLIVDDHTIVREGIRQLLDVTEDIRVEGEASQSSEMFNKLKEEEYDVILLDISLPGRNGVETLKELQEYQPNIPVLILSMHPEEQYALRVMKAGAAGYLTKKGTFEEMVHAIRTVAGGRKYISSSLAETLAEHINGSTETLEHHSLSDREFEVLKRIASGQPLKDIAANLSLSVKTISTYRSRILKKLGLKNNSEIVRYAMNHKLINN